MINYSPIISHPKHDLSDPNYHVFEYTPEMFTGANDTERINNAIIAASASNITRVVCNGEYYLDSAILMLSNVTLVNNGLIKMKDGMKDNIVRAAIASSTPISNIKIEGNGIFQGHSDGWGGYPAADVSGESWRAIGVLFANVENFEVSNITLKNTPMWGFCCEQSRYGKFNNVTVLQDNSSANQDGINIRRGSHNITVDGLYGITYDDTFAITNLSFGDDLNYLSTTIYEPGRSDLNIYQITAKNINRPDTPSGSIGSYTPPVNYGGVLLLCEDAFKIHDVFIDGILGSAQVNVGFTSIDYSVTTDATVNDMYNIHIRNVATAAIYTNRPIKNSSFINVPDRDVTDTYDSVDFQSGSLNVMKKYHNSDFVFEATVA